MTQYIIPVTCFWDALRSSLSLEDYEYSKQTPATNHPELIKLLKKKSIRAGSVSWQDSTLRSQEMDEHIEAIKAYDITKIQNGHLTSTCDSFLLLICEIFHLNIIHNFSGTLIKYTCQNPRKTLKFKSNRGHFAKS